MTTQLHHAPVDDPAAWTGAGIGGRAGFTHHLSQAQLDAIERLVERTRGRPPHEITRADFSSPEVDALMAGARNQLQHGAGAIILSGIDADRYDLDAHERLYWGLGAHVGVGVAQSGRGDFIAHVQREDSGPQRG